MKFVLIAFLASLFLTVSALAEERVDLTTVDQAQGGTVVYSVAQLVLDWERGRIVVRLVGDNNVRKEVVLGDAENARSMMRSLNKANLSVKSLHRRIMEELITRGYLAGSISGTPD